MTKINAEGAGVTLGWFFWACKARALQKESIHNTLPAPLPDRSSLFGLRRANMELNRMRFKTLFRGAIKSHLRL